VSRTAARAVANSAIKVQVEEKFYARDPTTTALGVRIVEQGILMLDEIGFEQLTFRKLAGRLGTAEPSIYRYFRNKRGLLLYLTAWYWSWMEVRLMFATANVASAEDRLRRALLVLTQPIIDDETTPHVDEAALYRVVVSESSKVYLQRDVDAENREGLFRSYKRLCQSVGLIIAEINPDYPFPVALISTVVESSHKQRYFAEHLPSLTEVDRGDPDSTLTDFLTDLVFKTIAVSPRS
jgi:AcrR family transcriptional regulator